MMEEDAHDPLALSLAEIIKLNQLRNREANDQSTPKELPKGLPNGNQDNHEVDNIRNNNVNENRTIFDRLGWNNTNTMRQKTLKAIRCAQNIKNKSNVTRKVRNNSARMPPPLTARVLKRHNQSHDNFMVKRRRGPGSTYSAASSHNMRQSYRHSLKGCLNPKISESINAMINSNRAISVFTSGGQEMVVDAQKLRNYVIKCDSTAHATHVRFALNDQM